MSVTELLDLIKKGAEILPKVKELVSKNYGVVHKRTRAEIDGKTGDLVWDYIVWNEITFKEDDECGGKIYSLGNRFSDKQTEELWDELVKKFGR